MVSFAYLVSFLPEKRTLVNLFMQNLTHGPKKQTKFASQNKANYHLSAVVQAESLKTAIQNPSASIDNQLRQIRQADIIRNRAILQALAEAILLCGRQGIALRGHRDDSTAESDSNRDTFLALLDYSVKSGNKVLANHFKECSKNATYTSKTTQNDLIQAIGDHLRDKLLLEIKAAKWYSVLCDEVTDISDKEQVSLVLRFVDSACDIREEFLEFVNTD